MPFTVILIVLLAALLHAGWNFLIKRSDDKHLSMSAVVFGHLPFAVCALLFAPWPKPDSLPYILTGAVLHAGYQLFLIASYRTGDLSHVYPLARGVAPLIVAGASVAFLGAHLSRAELAAVAMIGIGIMSLAFVRRSDGMRNRRAALLAVVTGGFIAAYSLVDGLGARAAGTTLGFFGWLSIINTLLFTVAMRIIRPGTVTRLICGNWQLSLGVGGASFGAYAMVIWAFTVAPIALVTALRETSILFALFLGALFLNERLDRMKWLATLLTVLGVLMLRLQR